MSHRGIRRPLQQIKRLWVAFCIRLRRKIPIFAAIVCALGIVVPAIVLACDCVRSGQTIPVGYVTKPDLVAVIDQQPLVSPTEPTVTVNYTQVVNPDLDITVGVPGEAGRVQSVTLFYGPQFSEGSWFCYPQITQFGPNSTNTVPVYSQSVILRPVPTNPAQIKLLSEKAAFPSNGTHLDPTGVITFKADNISAALIKRSFAGMSGSAGLPDAVFNGVGCQQFKPGVTQTQIRTGRWRGNNIEAPLYQETIRMIAIPEVVAVEKSGVPVHPCPSWQIYWPLTWSTKSGDFTSTDSTAPGQLRSYSADCHAYSNPAAVLTSQSWTFNDSDAINNRNAKVSTASAIGAIFVGVLVSFMLTVKPKGQSTASRSPSGRSVIPRRLRKHGESKS